MKRLVLIGGLLGLIVSAYNPALCAREPSLPLPLASHLSKKYQDDLKGLLAKRLVRVLTTFNRTNFFIAGGRFYGFEYVLLKDYEKLLNKDLKKRELRVVLEFFPVPRDALMPALVEGYGDIAAAGLTITPERKERVDFTDPYLSNVNEVVVAHKRTSPRLSNIEALSGRSVFVRKSSSYYASLKALNKTLVQSGKRPVKIVVADENLETEDILELVNAGVVGITVADNHIASIWSGVLKNIVVHKDLKLRSGGQIAWMVRKNNPKLKASLNTFLKTHKKGTLLGNIYFKRYYQEERWIKNPLEAKEKRKLERYRGLFQKYAKIYDFDWVLIAALAYQESGLDPRKKSPSGAIGIMQVLPSTAKDKKVGVVDIHRLENNIHAGVKYLAFLRDRYFHDQSIRRRDRVRMALASYNAGPAKIHKARSLAEKMGYDPNRWFRNVELATLKLVGQETVRYVSNINKYYITYRLALMDIEKRNQIIKEKP